MRNAPLPQGRALLGKIHESLTELTAEMQRARALERAGERIKRVIDVITMFGIWAAAIVGGVAIRASGSDAEKQRDKMSDQYKTMVSQSLTLEKQATLAAQQLPRAWLYVEFPHLAVKLVRVGRVRRVSPRAPDTIELSWRFQIPFQVTNYGQIPGTVVRIQAFKPSRISGLRLSTNRHPRFQ